MSIFDECTLFPHQTDSSTHQFRCQSILGVPWDNVADWLFRNGFTFNNPSGLMISDGFSASPFSAKSDPGNLATREDCVGGIVVPNDMAMLKLTNKKGDFREHLPFPCVGRLKRSRVAQLECATDGHVMSIGDELVFSERIGELMSGCGIVWQRSTLLSGNDSMWFRAVEVPAGRAVDPVCRLGESPCALCGMPYFGGVGVWLGIGELASPILQDEIGFRHNAQFKPLIVSKELATQLRDEIGLSGFGILPLYKSSTLVAQTTARLVQMLNQISRG